MLPQKPNALAFVVHETVFWALASLFLAMTGSFWMIVINAARFVANLTLSYYQSRAGGAQHSHITPYFSQLGVASLNAIFSVLEVLGILSGSGSHTEALYRSKLYTLNSFFYLSAGINDSKFHTAVEKMGFLSRTLLNPNFWLGPAIFISFSYAFTPVLKSWGIVPYSAIPWISALLGLLCLSVSVQAIVQAYWLRAGFWSRHYGIVLQAVLNLSAGLGALYLGNTSWEFAAYMLLWSAGNIAYLWRNRQPPEYLIRDRKPTMRESLGSTHYFPMLAK